MKIYRSIAVVAAAALLALPALASAQVYYYSSGNSYGSYNGAYSYIPAAAMPYVQYGNQMAQQYQQQYQSYSYPTQYQSQSQSQSQYQTSYPSYSSYTTPTYNSYSYPTSNSTGEYSSEPQSVTYPSGTYGPFGTQLCYWSDYSGYAPCGKDPQQWIQDPYTGDWY